MNVNCGLLTCFFLSKTCFWMSEFDWYSLSFNILDSTWSDTSFCCVLRAPPISDKLTWSQCESVSVFIFGVLLLDPACCCGQHLPMVKNSWNTISSWAFPGSSLKTIYLYIPRRSVLLWLRNELYFIIRNINIESSHYLRTYVFYFS